jgi:NAD(P)-dependent dehydrogenase (short-subunit alcohol dehydrogenase family)
VEAVIRRFGSVDILVNNSDANPASGSILDQDYLRFTKTFGVNTWAPLLWTSLVARAGMGERGGTVINIASTVGTGFEAGGGLYTTSTAALIHLTKELALEMSPKVRVNTVVSGRLRSATASARIGEPDDIGTAIAFLASDVAGWVTGETYVIDEEQHDGVPAPWRGSAISSA